MRERIRMRGRDEGNSCSNLIFLVLSPFCGQVFIVSCVLAALAVILVLLQFWRLAAFSNPAAGSGRRTVEELRHGAGTGRPAPSPAACSPLPRTWPRFRARRGSFARRDMRLALLHHPPVLQVMRTWPVKAREGVGIHHVNAPSTPRQSAGREPSLGERGQPRAASRTRPHIDGALTRHGTRSAAGLRSIGSTAMD